MEVRNITSKTFGEDKTIVDQIGGQLGQNKKREELRLGWCGGREGFRAQGRLLAPPSEHTGDNSQTLRKGWA